MLTFITVTHFLICKRISYQVLWPLFVHQHRQQVENKSWWVKLFSCGCCTWQTSWCSLESIVWSYWSQVFICHNHTNSWTFSLLHTKTTVSVTKSSHKTIFTLTYFFFYMHFPLLAENKLFWLLLFSANHTTEYCSIIYVTGLFYWEDWFLYD